LELWVNDARAFRLEPGNGDPNVIGVPATVLIRRRALGPSRGTQNSVSAGIPRERPGEYNQATANGAVVGGGYDNKASAAQAMVGRRGAKHGFRPGSVRWGRWL